MNKLDYSKMKEQCELYLLESCSLPKDMIDYLLDCIKVRGIIEKYMTTDNFMLAELNDDEYKLVISILGNNRK